MERRRIKGKRKKKKTRKGRKGKEGEREGKGEDRKTGNKDTKKKLC